MLSLGEKSFTTGRAKFQDQGPGVPEATAKIFVRIEFPAFEGSWLAQVDSGSAYSMLEVEVAQALDVLNGDGQPASIHTRVGTFEGRLERIPLARISHSRHGKGLSPVV
jgi:hypothetical protein